MPQEITLTTVNVHDDTSVGDIIFIHGLGGDGVSTWKNEGTVGKRERKKDSSIFFPSILSADFPRSNVWTLDYSSKASSWQDSSNFNELSRVCIEILEYLIGKEIGNKPLILISHSLGGIVVKQLLKLSFESINKRHKSIYDQTKAISFIATPHAGSKWADTLSNINSVLKVFRTSDRIEELKFDNTYLEQLSKWHKDNVDHKKIETQAFYEAKKTGPITIVEKQSANPHVKGCDPIRINENHINICKPTNKDCTLYVSICGLIRHHFYDETALDRETIEPKILLRVETIVIGIVQHEGKVLMVKRRDNIDGLTWQFIAGRLKHGESEQACIIREISEETKVRAKVVRKIGTGEGGKINIIRHYYICEYLDGVPENGDPFENEEAAWVPVDKVRKFVTTSIFRPVSEYLGI